VAAVAWAAWAAWAIWICDAATQPRRPGSSGPSLLNFRFRALNSLRRNRSAARLSRCGCTRMPSPSPSCSTARRRYSSRPLMLRKTSSKCQRHRFPLVALDLASRAVATELITASAYTTPACVAGFAYLERRTAAAGRGISHHLLVVMPLAVDGRFSAVECRLSGRSTDRSGSGTAPRLLWYYVSAGAKSNHNYRTHE
jgi:hypothetical protein